MSYTTDLLPCPFCGGTYPFTYICFNTAVLLCKCGATMDKAAVTVMYKKDELPEALAGNTYEATGLVIQSKDGSEKAWPEHGYIGISAPAAFEHAGITAKWNRRILAKVAA